MSNNDERPTFNQAGHVLRLIGDQGLSNDQVNEMCDGYLPALAKSTVEGKLPLLVDFKRALGLSHFHGKTNNLVLLSGEHQLILDACKGDDVIALNNVGPFNYVSTDFANWEANEAGPDTPETEVGVYRITKNANYRNFFGSFGTDYDNLCLTTSQIKSFCRKFKSWLCQDGYATFFLFKSKGKFFVAYVKLCYLSGLDASVDRLESDDVLGVDYRHRLVVPQF